MRRSLKRKEAAPPPQENPDCGLHFGPTAAYDPVASADADRLEAATLEFLSDVGVRFDPGTEADALLSQAGCKVGPDGVVRFPAAVVRQALATTARSARLWNRDGTRFLTLDSHHTWFFPGMTCIKVFDLDTGEHRDSTLDDLATITRIADGLPHIDGVCVACKDVPHSDIFGEIAEFACLAENTTKPLEYLCENAESLEVVIAMAAAIRGGRDRLAEKPYFLHIVTPLPVYYAETHIRQILTAARAGIPVSTGTLAIGGASSPITMAGCIVHCLATDFAGMVLAQCARPGAFCIGSADVNFMEPATGGIGALSQTNLAEMVMCQIRRRLGLPSFTGLGGAAKSRDFNQDAVWEISTGMTQTFYTRPATCDYLGTIDQGFTFSLPALLLCCDLAGLLRTQWRGVPVDDEHVALDLMREIGPFGNFLGHAHTARHCRKGNWPSAYFGANEPLSTSGKPAQDLLARLEEDLHERLAAPPPPALPAAIGAEIAAIQQRFRDGFRA